MLNVNRNLRIVRASALYDLLVTAPFMTPWTAALCLQGFATLSNALALERPVPIPDVTAMLFANLLGSIVVVWSMWRLKQPSRQVGLFDAAARVLFALWQLYAVKQGASFLLLGFTFFEVIFAVAQALPIHTASTRQSASAPLSQPSSVT
ncbi:MULTISPECIES: hypothetical protein [unclassified Pseudomonas]|uniref:hypothetical protein n=1 Tax=unclassified Pseudomonas TaxID=196821 RepID=UPI00384C9E50